MHLKARLFGVGEEINMDYNLRIHRFPRGNACLKVSTLHPPIHMGSALVAPRQRGLFSGCTCVAHTQATSRDNEKLFEEIYDHFPLAGAIMTTT